MESKLFDVAENHAIEILKKENRNYKYPVFELESGTWFGSIYALIKVEPYNDFDEIRNNFERLENMYPSLKEKKEIRDDFNQWFDSLSPEKIQGNEIEFTDLLLQVTNNMLATQIGRVYKYKNELGMVSPNFDYLSYNLKNSLKYISKGVKKPIIGLKPGLKDKTIKERAVVVVMPLDYDQKEINESIKETHKVIADLKGVDE